MRLLRKPERWMCLPASFAMVLDLPLGDIFREIGHDGSQVVWPDLLEPACVGVAFTPRVGPRLLESRPRRHANRVFSRPVYDARRRQAHYRLPG